MVQNRIKMGRDKLAEIAIRCGEFAEAPSRREALARIAEYVSAEIGRYLNAGMLLSPDDVSIAFIELLDQILFEMNDENNVRNGIDEYIIDDLYRRVEVYLELFRGIDVYKKNFHLRLLSHDDTIIIKEYRIAEFLPGLMLEFHEQPHLAMSILRVLMFFSGEELLNFFYQIAQGDYDEELKVCALVGLKNNSVRFHNWRLLKGGESAEYNGLIALVAAESTGKSTVDDHAGVMDSPLMLFYRMLDLELQLENQVDIPMCKRVVGTLYDVCRLNLEGVIFRNHIYDSLTRIFNRIQCDAMKRFLQDDENITSFVYLIDCLPIEVFDRLAAMLEYLGDEFMASVERLVSRGVLHLDEKNSRLSGYLFSLGFDSLHL